MCESYWQFSFLLQSVQLVQTLHVSNLALRRSGVPLRLKMRCSPALYTGPEHDSARDQLPAFAHHKGGSEVEEGRPLLVLRDADVAVLVRWEWMNGGRFGGYAYQNLRKWPFAVIVNQVSRSRKGIYILGKSVVFKKGLFCVYHIMHQFSMDVAQ